jgi:hypothetical protein
MSKNTGTSELINYFDLGANGDVGIAGSLDVNTIANATTDTDKFLVSDTGIIKYRTGAELLTDIGAQGLLTNPVTGTGTAGQVTYWSSSSAITGESNLFWDATNDRLGIGINSPSSRLEVFGSTKTALNIVNASVLISSLIQAETYFSVSGSTSNISYNGTSIGLSGLSGFGTVANFVVGGFRTVLPRGWTGTVSLTANANSVSLGTIVSIETSTDGSSFTTRATASVDGTLTYTETTPLGSALFLRIRLESGSGSPVAESACRFANLFVSNLFAEINNTFSVGIKYPELNSISINTSDVERMRITSGGNVGIGTASITDSRVQVKGANNTVNAFADGLKVTSNNETVFTQYSWAGINSNDRLRIAIAGTELMSLFNTGNLFIGTSPSDAGFKLDVNGTGRFSGTLRSNDHEIKNSANSETLDLFLSPSTLNGFIDYPSGRSLTIRNKGSLSTFTLASTGAATFSSSVTSSSNFNVTRNGLNTVQAGYLLETTSGTLYLVNQQLDASGGLATWTYNPTNGWNSRMTLTSGGNVGIGTNNPQRKFVIADASGNGLEISNSSGYSTLLAYNRTTSAYQNIVLTEGTGNVLIGTTTDAGFRLDVNGTVRFVGALTVNQIYASNYGKINNVTWSGGYSTTVTLNLATVFPSLTFTSRWVTVKFILQSIQSGGTSVSCEFIMNRTENLIWTTSSITSTGTGMTISSATGSDTTITLNKSVTSFTFGSVEVILNIP